jgi:hypothetical protein
MDTTSLRDIISAGGPYASVYFATSDTAADGSLRWRALADQLEAQNADQATLSALEHRLNTRPAGAGPAGRALVASGGEVLLDRDLFVRPRGSVARFSAMPYLLPLVELVEPLLPHLVVHIDEVGADLCGMDNTGNPVAVATVGSDDALTPRPAAGRVDDLVRHSVQDVADEIVKLVERIGALLVVLVGEPGARSTVCSQLPAQFRDLCIGVDPDAAEDGPRAFDVLAMSAHQDEQRAVVQRFRTESARRGGRTVHGLRDVAAALSAGQVATLLVTDALIGDRLIDSGSLESLNSGRADEVLPRAAVTSGADIVLVGRQLRLREDVGALLRR